MNSEPKARTHAFAPVRSHVDGHLDLLSPGFEVARVVIEPEDDGQVGLDFWSNELLAYVEGPDEEPPADLEVIKVFLTLADAKALQAQLEATIRAAEARRL
jgi:hypothetical protein